MKLEFFQKLKIKAGLSIAADYIGKLDAEDFAWAVEQAQRLETIIKAEQQYREEARAASERKDVKG